MNDADLLLSAVVDDDSDDVDSLGHDVTCSNLPQYKHCISWVGMNGFGTQQRVSGTIICACG